MSKDILNIEDLSVSVEDNQILHDLDLRIGEGEVHVIMGPNGAGKSTLAAALMGNPDYTVDTGKIEFMGEDIGELSVSDRARKGLFLSFQNPVEIPGVSLENFIRSAAEQRTGQKIRFWDFRQEMRRTLDTLQMDRSYAERDLNVGFSGGEKKKAEILQMLMLKPSLAILDETDSGLDVDAVRTVSKGVEEFRKDKSASLLIITHNAAILSSLNVDAVHVLVKGRIVADGGPELIERISNEGFASFEESAT